MVELIVALAVFGILIVPVSKIVDSIIKINKSSHDNIEVASLMNQCVEYVNKNKDNIEEEDFDLLEHMESSGVIDKVLADNYMVDCHIDWNYKEGNLYGIENDKSDLKFIVCDGVLKLQYDVYNNGEEEDKWTSILKPDEENKFLVKVTLLNDGIIEYLIYDKESDKDDYVHMRKIDVDRAFFGIDFCGGGDLKITLVIDGVYDEYGKLISSKSICLNYSNIDEDKVKFISTSPFVVISKKDSDSGNLAKQKNMANITITIKDKQGNKLKTQTYNFSNKLK